MQNSISSVLDRLHDFDVEKEKTLRPINVIMDEACGSEKDPVDYLKFINKEVGCPQRFTDAFPSDFPDSVKRWTEMPVGEKGLFIFGGVGSGKTHTIYALAKLFRANKMKVKVKNVPDWLDELRSHYDGNRSEREIIYELRFDGVLILDDLGTEKQSEWTSEIMYRLVNNRYEQIRPTIFSSNLDLEEIGKRYGDRIASRIIEMVGGEKGIIKIGGKDRRIN